MRARNIKPGFFKNERLADVPLEARLLFIGLWLLADREGYLEYRPKRIRAEIAPYDEWEVEDLLCSLAENGFVEIYEHKETRQPLFIHVINFTKHQNPHVKEKCSKIKGLLEHSASTMQARYNHSTCPADSGFPLTDSLYNVPNIQNVQEQPDPSVDPVLSIPLKKKGESFSVTQNDIEEWQNLFVSIDVLACLKKIKEWNGNNQSRRKTRSGIRRHITSWLEREQNKGIMSAISANTTVGPVIDAEETARRYLDA